LKAFCLLAVPLLVSQMLAAQTPEPAEQSAEPPAKLAAPVQPPATGTITGHVYLGDSHLPARMAYVTLLPGGVAKEGEKKPVVSSAVVQTGLDGAYLMPNVLPGTYYVIAAKLGYATAVPISYIDSDDFDNAPRYIKESLTAVLTPVVVAANRVSTADIVLDRGAAIAGSVRFDDGEPYSQTTVSLLRKDKSGKWTDFATQESVFGGGARTDDQGNFRLTGLPSGEYLLRTTLELQGAQVQTPGVDSPHEPNYRWDVYYGYGIRPTEAKIINLKEGEQSQGNILEIPLARMHSISGTVISAETSAPINQADVELHNAADDSTCTVTAINSATGQFHFPYVAEGEYTLKVTKAADVASGGRSHDEKPLRTYADASQSLIVKGETNGITITVKPQPPAGIAAPAVTSATQ
jgi:Carboxypeptidase regulatory-like domain